MNRTITHANTLSRTTPYVKTLNRSILYLNTLSGVIPYLNTLSRIITYVNTLSRTIPYLKTLNRAIPSVNTLSRTIPYLNTLSRTIPSLNTLSRTIPYLNTLRKNPSLAQNRILVGSQSEWSTKNPKTSSANQNRVSQCRKKTKTLSAMLEDPSRPSAPAEPSRLAIAYLNTWRVLHPPT